MQRTHRLILAVAGTLVCSVALGRPVLAQHTHPDTTRARPKPDMAGMSHMEHGEMGGMTLPLGIPHARMGSGTSWVPDASSHRDYQMMAGQWMLMGHGLVDVYYDHQSTPRGHDQLGSTNWLMGMAMHPLGGGMIQFDAMLSAEPFTVGDGGYPLLLQSGESYQGRPLHDRQHPHDLFMELGVTYDRSIGGGLAVSLYAAPVGEPALGPVAFMHRPSAESDPFAPIAHHWQDATHITFGVTTLGIYSRSVKLEGSIFNGREPDEHRYDFDFRPLDSWSVRALANPAPQWSLSASVGYLKSPEGLSPDESEHRFSASIMHTSRFGRGGEIASAVIYGANRRKPAGSANQPLENSVIAESNLRLDGRNVLYGRMTWVQKTAEELVLPGLSAEQRFGLTTASAGYARDLAQFGHTALALGVRGEVGFVPAALRPVYGTRHPAGLAVYLRLHPMVSSREHGMVSSASPSGA
ncbi:MAG TPA: hypothetical protein VFU23_09545 [Gemmatimonadales bacterium]|nr:hypothetical protein [Gemmatimonadales bacterium]